jgi:hypothetical protein
VMREACRRVSRCGRTSQPVRPRRLFLLNKFNVGKKEGDSFQFQEDRTKRVRDLSSHRMKTTVMWFSSIAAVEMIGGPAVAVILAGE